MSATTHALASVLNLYVLSGWFLKFGSPRFLLGGDYMLWYERSGVGVRFRTQAKDGSHEQQPQLTAATVGVVE